MDVTNQAQAFGLSKFQVEETRNFLHRLAKHLEDNGMPGQAANCTIQASKLQQVGVALAYLERTSV